MTTPPHNSSTGAKPDGFWDPSRVSARRTLLLCGAGALIGLGIAGFSLFTAKGTRTYVVPPEDVALVNQSPILMSDYAAQIQALFAVSLGQATRSQKTQVLNDMIREELYVQRGVELGTQEDTIEVRTALVGAVEAQAVADADMSEPDELTLRAWYTAHASDYQLPGSVAVIDYVLPKGSSPGVAKAFKSANATPEAATHLGLKPSGRVDGSAEWDFAAKIHLGPNLFQQAITLRDGQVSNAIVDGPDTHILVMVRNIRPVEQPFDTVHDKIIRDYRDAEAKRLAAGNDAFLRKRADILIADGYQ